MVAYSGIYSQHRPQSGSRGPGFDPHGRHHVVSLSSATLTLQSTGLTQEAKAEKLLTGMLNME